MVHQKSFRAIIIILLLVCTAVFAGSSLAEQPTDQADYYIFIASGNEAGFADYLPDIFNAFSFLHPDYVEVKLHIYQAPEFNRRTDNCIELYSGAAGTPDSFNRIKTALSKLGSKGQNGAVKAADQILKGAGSKNAKVIFAGSFNIDGVNQLKTRWLPLAKSRSYAVLNSNEAQRGSVPGTVLIRSDVPGTVKDLFDQLCKSTFDQKVTAETTKANEYSTGMS